MPEATQSSKPKPKTFQDTAIWKLKVRMQFSGWLQYLIHAIFIMIVLLVSGIGWLIGDLWLGGGLAMAFFWVPFVYAMLHTAVLVGSIIIVKYGFHPEERIPRAKTDLDAFDLMRARRSCRAFQSRDLLPDHKQELMEVARSLTAQQNLLGDRPVRFEYVAAPLTVWPVVGAHEFFVAIVPKEYNRLAVIDVGRSLQKVVTHATKMGLATCWIGPGADHKSIVSFLKDRFDPDADHVICVCAIGYASRFIPPAIYVITKLQNKRLPLEDLFFSDPAFSTPMETTKAPFNAYGRCYEACQWSPSSFNSQTTRVSAVTTPTADGQNILRFDFAAATTSRYYAAVALGIWCANWETGCEALGLPGHFTVLPPSMRGNDETPELPVYDISWVVE